MSPADDWAFFSIHLKGFCPDGLLHLAEPSRWLRPGFPIAGGGGVRSWLCLARDYDP